jgi:hypothetical protein
MPRLSAALGLHHDFDAGQARPGDRPDIDLKCGIIRRQERVMGFEPTT